MTDASNVASVPFMITQEMKRRLHALGRSDKDIANLTPQQAHDILAREWCVELTMFEKANGPLTKRITLAADGSVRSDGGACLMARGAARRLHIAGLDELAAVIERMRPDQAIALGALCADLPDSVRVVTKKNLNGQPDTIARTAAHIIYRKGTLVLALLDFDTKGMPPNIAAEIERLGGFWPALVSVLPALRSVAHLIRRSTSAGLFRADTGAALPGSSGLHVYVPVEDGADIERFLRVLHDLCWLAGFGWMEVGAGGQMLERSVIDRMVGAPERLIFEANPILGPLLGQDRDSRRPMVTDGGVLDTVAACPPLTIIETAKLRTLKAKEALRLAPDSAKVRTAFVAEHAKRFAERAGISVQAAEEQVARQCDGVLLPDIELLFDDEEFVGCTVADVLADPARFEGATLADPLEGVAYGVCKARVMRRADGTPWINSFAHGRTVYELKRNAAMVRAAMAAAPDADVVKTLVKFATTAEISDDELEVLRDEACKRSGINKRTVSKMLKAAKQEHIARRQQQEHERRLADRNDPRPVIASPSEDAPWLPQMNAYNDVVDGSPAIHPVARDIDGVNASGRKIVVPDTHAFTADTANARGVMS